jgi:threonylcarbamoyladenosine tRNA methylthiotransferase MtaB
MPPVAPDMIRERAARLRAVGAHALRRHLDGQVGRRLTILAERGGVGRSADFTPVRLAAALPPGTLHSVAIAAHDGARLIAS